MDHFLGDIGVSTEEKPNGPMPGNDNNKHHQYNYYNNAPYQQPQAPVGPTSADYVLSLQSPWIMAIGGVLAVILTLNIAFL
eukprot:CAMPEP_0197020872 /NCGR_PEP_ID=MMETSP1384-20130603/1741_1 /TAXON_ID=29189 /ORGANISM="Ammonia sp." /LENGTH=80 /DNA_ID=CAMNT_0042448585 /DNA_START=1 /DNA_END=240 /DNA_ORIENTATION=-